MNIFDATHVLHSIAIFLIRQLGSRAFLFFIQADIYFLETGI